jgi:hypothetical protein
VILLARHLHICKPLLIFLGTLIKFTEKESQLLDGKDHFHLQALNALTGLSYCLHRPWGMEDSVSSIQDELAILSIITI